MLQMRKLKFREFKELLKVTELTSRGGGIPTRQSDSKNQVLTTVLPLPQWHWLINQFLPSRSFHITETSPVFGKQRPLASSLSQVLCKGDSRPVCGRTWTFHLPLAWTESLLPTWSSRFPWRWQATSPSIYLLLFNKTRDIYLLMRQRNHGNDADDKNHATLTCESLDANTTIYFMHWGLRLLSILGV